MNRERNPEATNMVIKGSGKITSENCMLLAGYGKDNKLFKGTVMQIQKIC